MELLAEASGLGAVEVLHEAFEGLARGVRVAGLFPGPVEGLLELALVGVPPDALQVSMDVYGLPVGYTEVLQPPSEGLAS